MEFLVICRIIGCPVSLEKTERANLLIVQILKLLGVLGRNKQ